MAVTTQRLTPAHEAQRLFFEIMNEPPVAIAALSVADQRTLRDVLKRAVENLH